jgi:hypothetical protein
MASDEYLRALGEVTVEASGLEWCVAYLLAYARNGDEEYITGLVAKPGQVRAALRKFRSDVESEHGHECSFSAGIASLEERTSQALNQRNALVHSIETIQLSQWSGEIVSFMANSRIGNPQHASIEMLHRLADEIRGVGGTALRMSTRVAQWRSIHDDYWI